MSAMQAQPPARYAARNAHASSKRPDCAFGSARRGRRQVCVLKNTANKLDSHIRQRTNASASSSSSSSSSSMSAVDVPHLVALLVDLAHESCHIIRNVTKNGTLGVKDKGGSTTLAGEYVMDAQTEADRQVESTVLAAIRTAFPAVDIVAEEESEGMLARPDDEKVGKTIATRDLAQRHPSAVDALDAVWPPELRVALPADDVVVFIDPLDGTNEYANGARECVTCLYGVAYRGRPIAGVIGQPFPEILSDDDTTAATAAPRIVWGGSGVGVHGINEAQQTSLPKPPPFRAAINRNLRDPRQEPVMERLGPATEEVKISATGYHFLKILERRVHVQIMLRRASKKWDSCAGEALLTAAGGFVGDSVGRRDVYSARPDCIQNLCGLVSMGSAEWYDDVFSVTRQVAEEQAEEGVGPLKEYWPYDVEDPSVEQQF